MSDDEVMDEGELEGEILADPDLDAEGLDEDSLDLDIEEDLLVDPELADPAEAEDPDAIVEEAPVARKAKGEEEDEEDEDLRTEDDVEADLDAILREKLTAAEETPLKRMKRMSSSMTRPTVWSACSLDDQTRRSAHSASSSCATARQAVQSKTMPVRSSSDREDSANAS